MKKYILIRDRDDKYYKGNGQQTSSLQEAYKFDDLEEALMVLKRYLSDTQAWSIWTVKGGAWLIGETVLPFVKRKTEEY